MNNKYLLIGLFISTNLLCSFSADGQPLVETDLKTLFDHAETVHQDYTKPIKESKNEIDVAISTTFLLYKTFISSQDVPVCTFTPSCSEYSVEAFQKRGLLIGWVNSFDRLSRCHGFVKQGHYPFDNKKYRFYDPVE